MKCKNCGFERTEDFKFCPNCGQSSLEAEQTQNPAPDSEQAQKTDFSGEQAIPAQPITLQSPMAERMLSLFKDSFFLVLCILQSAALLFEFCCSNFSVLGILFTIFLWLIYAQSKNNITDIKNMRSISGTIFAKYVINWVVCGIFAFFGILLTAFYSVLSVYGIDIMNMLRDKLDNFGGKYYGFLVRNLSVGVILIGIIFIIAAIVVAVINVFATRSIHRFAQSVYQSSENSAIPIVKKNTAQSWFLVIGILKGISAFFALSGNAFGFLTAGCSAAVYVFAYLLIKKYFSDINA